MDSIELSIVIPAFNEEENVEPLVHEIVSALGPTGRAYEILVVDDGSTDDTAARLADLMPDVPPLRVLRLPPTGTGRGNGQSLAMRTGFHAARGRRVAGLDADRQNDPADLPGMLELMDDTGADFVQGDRSANRRDTFVRRVSSRVGRAARRLLLRDAVTDTGCSLRVMRAEIARSIPLEYHGLHRFIPFLAAAQGHRIIETPVRHRPRATGSTKYGIRNRALPGLIDCFAVRWMVARRRRSASSEIPREIAAPEIAAPEIVVTAAPLSKPVRELGR